MRCCPKVDIIITRLHYVVLCVLICFIAYVPSGGAQDAVGTPESSVELSQPDQVPTATMPTEPNPLPTETAPLDTVPVPTVTEVPAPVATEQPAISVPGDPVVVDPLEVQPTATEPIAVPSPPTVEPTATSPLNVEIPPTTEPTPVPTPSVEPTATEIPAATLESTPGVEPSPSPTQTPVTISLSQPDSVTCITTSGDAQSLSPGDSATWRCQATVVTEITGEAPADLQVLWQVNATYAGDDVRVSLPEGSLATEVQSDPLPGGVEESVTYRMSWNDGLVLAFDVTVTRTSCAVGEMPLSLSAGVEVETADASVSIVQDGSQPAEAQLLGVAAPNQDVPTLDIQPVTFGAIQWTGQSWGTAEATIIIHVNNDGCATSDAHDIQIEAIALAPGVQPVIVNVTTSGGNINAVAPVTPGQTAATVAHIPAGFVGESQVVVTFDLTPQAEVAPGGYSMQFDVKVLKAP